MEQKVPPQMPDTRPDMRQIALFVKSNVACRWNKMLLAELNVDIPRAVIAVAMSTEHDERPDATHQVWKSGRVTVVRFFRLRGPFLHTLKLFQPRLPSGCSMDFVWRHEFVLG